MEPLSNDMIMQVRQSVRIEDVVGLRVALRRKGRDLIGLCPFHNDHHPSMKVDPQKGFYKCHACGAGGDAIGFLMKKDGLPFPDAIRQLAEYYGIAGTGDGVPRLVKTYAPPPPAYHLDDIEADEQEIMKARRLFMQSVPAAGTLVENYLHARAIPLERLPEGVLKQIRFLPSVTYWHSRDGQKKAFKVGDFPAMIAPFQDMDGRIRGVHLTYLSPDGNGKMDVADPDRPAKKLNAKKMKGRPWGCSIRLGPPSPVMVISEGIENGLTSLVTQPDWSVWVAGSLGNMAGAGVREGDFHPDRPGRRLPSVYPNFCKPGMMPPPDCRRVIILGERDAGDQPSAECLIQRAARRYSQSGFSTRIAWAPEGMDHNDVLRQHAQGAAE